MRCEEVRPLISAAIDHELDEGPAALLQGHLAGCLPCSSEYDLLSSTVRLLQAVPEVEPPVELSRRIGMALLEEERNVQRRGWVPLWLARPRTAGWAWGAAVGAAAATVVLVATRGPAPTPRLAYFAPPRPAAKAHSTIEPRSILVNPKSLSRTSAPPANTSSRTSHPLPPSGPAPLAEKPSVPADGSTEVATMPALPTQNARHPVTHPSHGTVSSSTSVHHGARIIRIQTASTHSPTIQHLGGRPVLSSRPETSSDGSARQTQKTSPSLMPPPSSTEPSDDDQTPDTSQMQHMASTPMPDSPTDNPDDLAALRQRLMDRPLQAPELGQLKPAGTPGSNRDGWIRF